MVHLFILFPGLIIMSAVMMALYRKHPNDRAFYYFRNFFLIWSACTIGVGAAETFIGTVPGVFTTLSLVLPFLYVAATYLIKVPFALTGKSDSWPNWPNILSAIAVIAGIFYGLSLFLSVQDLVKDTGVFEPIFQFMAKDGNKWIFNLHIFTMLAIFVPVGIFFFYEAAKSFEFQNRVRSAMIGIGLIIAGLAEWYHVAGLHADNRDFFLLFGFLLVIVGLIYPLYRQAVPKRV